MTVTYTADVANASSFGCFWKILLRWKGSVYKLIWRELLAYIALYFAVSLVYRLALDAPQREMFEKLTVYCSKQIESIPLTFVLGFYVSLVVKRWWDQYWVLPLPDSLALYISASIHGQDERGRILRRTIMRYAMLSFIIMLQRVSVRVKKRFPTLQHLVDAGLMMDCEKQILDKLEAKTSVSKFWVPAIWASNLVTRAREEGRISSDHMLQTILTELSEFRRKLGLIIIFDHVSVPLVYTQVVTLAVYTYFTAAVIGRQWVHPLDPNLKKFMNVGYELDLYLPIFLSLQFVFYIGWLKVAETLINPFGEDDDDYEMNWLIDRHIQVSYMVVDEIHDDHPELLKDHYWDQVVPTQLPYNEASNLFRRFEPKGSTATMKIKEDESIYDRLPGGKKRSSFIQDDQYEVVGASQSSQSPRQKNWFKRQLNRMESFRGNSQGSLPFAFTVMDETGRDTSPRRTSITSVLRGRRPSTESTRAKPRPSPLPPRGRTGNPSTLHPVIQAGMKRGESMNDKKKSKVTRNKLSKVGRDASGSGGAGYRYKMTTNSFQLPSPGNVGLLASQSPPPPYDNPSNSMPMHPMNKPLDSEQSIVDPPSVGIATSWVHSETTPVLPTRNLAQDMVVQSNSMGSYGETPGGGSEDGYYARIEEVRGKRSESLHSTPIPTPSLQFNLAQADYILNVESELNNQLLSQLESGQSRRGESGGGFDVVLEEEHTRNGCEVFV